MVEAIGQLATRRPRLRLLFCGPDRGCVDDAGRSWALQEFPSHRLSGVEVLERVDVLGHQTMDQIAALRRRAAVTVAPSRLETSGNTVIEAMAAGCPIVGTRCGGHEEIIRDGRNGLLAELRDPTSLADQIERLLDDRELADRLSAQAAADVANRHGSRIIAERTLRFYDQVLARCGHPK